MQILPSLLISLCLCKHVVFGISVPKISSTYYASGTIHYPRDDVEEPFTIWYDAINNRSRIDYYGGMVKTYQLPDESKYGTARKIVPITTEELSNIETCLDLHGNINQTVKIQPLFPDLTQFKYIGNDIINGIDCEVWRLSYNFKDEVNTLTMYLRRMKHHETNDYVAVPIMYDMKNPSHSYITLTDFNNDSPDPSIFDLPSHLRCKLLYSDADDTEYHHYVESFNPMQEFINNDVRHIDHAWSEFNKYHRKIEDYESQKEYNFRKQIFHQNYRFIQSMNRANLGYKLAVNQFADRTTEELKYLRGTIPSNTSDNEAMEFPYSFHTLSKIRRRLPKSFDWRLFGAVTPVKNQLSCGSCWSFSTTGVLEGAYFLKTGHLVRLSEQALVDCSWGFKNYGCDGGLPIRAYEWIMKHGGIPSDADYGPYLLQDGYCHIENTTMKAKISGYVRVTPKSEVALKTALVKHGPISIAIDASPKSFGFYSSGVYYEPKCSNTSYSLNHAVLLVGYGNLNGVPYWLVKNSWSNYWGNDGYMLISRKNNNCGVMTLPSYVIM